MRTNKESMKRNSLYALSQGGYWMYYCTTLSFAAKLLSDRGYTATKIGLVLAIGGFLSIFFQKQVATMADKSKRISLASILLSFYMASAICLGLIIMVPEEGALLSVIFIVLSVLVQSTRGLTNALCFRLSTDEVKVNFGIGRAIGSLLFAIVSAFIGQLADEVGSNIFPTAGIFVCVYMIIVLLVVSLTTDTCSKADLSDREALAQDTFLAFFLRYKRFFLFLLGMLLFYCSHCYINNFFPQVVENVNGTTGDLGGIYAFAAIMEIPIMFFFAKIENRIKTKPLLVISGVGFIVKTLLVVVSTNVLGIYIAHIFQAVSFATLIPACVSYVNSIMTEKDAVRGQAMVTIVTGIAFLIGSSTGGILIDKFGVRQMLIVGIVAAVFGVLIAAYALFGKEKTKGASEIN